MVPNKTIYVSDGDLPLFQRAQELAGGNLSAAITAALGRYVDLEEGRREGFDEIIVRVGPGKGRKVRFTGVFLGEWVNLLLRWAHVITGIAWIGGSFYFVALDNSLTPPEDEKDRAKGIGGELWAVHGGGFYHQQKYPVSPAKLPELLVLSLRSYSERLRSKPTTSWFLLPNSSLSMVA